MQDKTIISFVRLWRLMAALLILRVTTGVVLNYQDYFPANFESDFLRGREHYFFGTYQWAFYTHIFTGPLTLILGIVLLSESFQRRFSLWHRYLGRTQALVVLLLLTPSGLWMSYHAATGAIAAAGFATLSILTGTTVALGWYTAVKRKFAAHRRWMLRCFLLLCSAVFLRLTVGLMIVMQIEGQWIYPMAAWTSWLVPLTVYELTKRTMPLRRRWWTQPMFAATGQ